MSRVPSVDKDLDLLELNISLMPANVSDVVFLVIDSELSPSLADIIAFTSAAVFGITSIFKSLKSCSWLAAWDNARSLSCMSVRRDEHTHLR